MISAAASRVSVIIQMQKMNDCDDESDFLLYANLEVFTRALLWLRSSSTWKQSADWLTTRTCSRILDKPQLTLLLSSEPALGAAVQVFGNS